MKIIKSTKITKETRRYEVHPDLPGIQIKAIFENGRLKNATFEGKGPHKSYPIFVKSEFWEMIKTMSPWWQVNHKFGWDKITIEAKDIMLSQIANPDFLPNPKDFIFVYGPGHVLFDFNGDPIPIPYGFDYIGTPFTNKYCDLEPMVKHLKNHPWISNASELKIVKVPYYNNESGKHEFIIGEKLGCISIIPDKESYKEMYLKTVNKAGTDFDSTRLKELIFSDAPYNWEKTKEKDYLEIRQFYKPMKELED